MPWLLEDGEFLPARAWSNIRGRLPPPTLGEVKLKLVVKITVKDQTHLDGHFPSQALIRERSERDLQSLDRWPAAAGIAVPSPPNLPGALPGSGTLAVTGCLCSDYFGSSVGK